MKSRHIYFAKRKILGIHLSNEDKKLAQTVFVHRYTGEHTPSWAHSRMPNGQSYPLQFKDDWDWLKHTFFAVNPKGKLLLGFTCESNPTWPNRSAAS